MVGDTCRVDTGGVGPCHQGLDSLLRTETGVEDDGAGLRRAVLGVRWLAPSWWSLPASLATVSTPGSITPDLRPREVYCHAVEEGDGGQTNDIMAEIARGSQRIPVLTRSRRTVINRLE
jgi:hypothetical protein